MTTTVSSSWNSSPSPDGQVARLDEEIAHIRAEIAKLRRQKQNLSSALLASSSVRNIVQTRKAARKEISIDPVGRNDGANDEVYGRIEQAIARQQTRNDVQFHRMVNDVTAFPFTDPAPVRSGEGSMLGLRFHMPDISRESSSQDVGVEMGDVERERNKCGTGQTYLVMLRRINRGGKTYLRLQDDMNQVPKHIDVEGYAARFLPIPDKTDEEDGDVDSPSPTESTSFQDDSGIDVTQDLTHAINNQSENHTVAIPNPGPNLSTNIDNNGQNLSLFVQATRDSLLSWTNRTNYINHLQTRLLLPDPLPKPTNNRNNTSSRPSAPSYKHHLTHLSTTTPAATTLRLDWSNATTALLGLTETGHVRVARVFGPRMFSDDAPTHDPASWRCHEIERQFVRGEEGEHVGVWALEERLRVVGGLIGGGGGKCW